MFLGQFLFVLVILFFIYRLWRNFLNKSINKVQFIEWLVFWLIALGIVIWPETTSFLARVLGIGRGADLIIYLALFLIFYFIFSFTRRLKIIEKNITKIVQQMALDNYKKKSFKEKED